MQRINESKGVFFEGWNGDLRTTMRGDNKRREGREHKKIQTVHVLFHGEYIHSVSPKSAHKKLILKRENIAFRVF